MMRPKLQHVALFGAALAAVIAQATLYWWYVEDAAISMAFARNLADGWGLVRFPGDARVEGYSNPLWVFYMAAGYLVGIDGFTSTKVASVVLGALVSVPLVRDLTKRAGVEEGWAVAAAWILALDAQFVIWSACGLESGLFCALLAVGCWRTVKEAEVGGFPWAAVAFLGLALTRPEGIVYAAFAGFWALVLEGFGSRRWLRIAGWLAVFWVPFAVYHAIRFDYFAFEFPATYYAKLEEARFAPMNWSGRAWQYVREYSHETGRGFFLPVLLAGALSLRGWRGGVAIGLSLWVALLLLFPGVEPLLSIGWPTGLTAPGWWVPLRIASLTLVAFAVPLLALGSEGWRVRTMMWTMALLAMLFCLRSTGDWMRGFRWMSLLAVPASVLIALGCAEIARMIEGMGRTPRWRHAGIAVGFVVFATSVGTEIAYMVRYRPEVGPFSVKARVDHYAWALRKLHLETAHIIDHDMGAMLYWGGEIGIVRDAKGLIDYPFALHHANPRFVEEYIFEENPFELAHAHASTGRVVRRVRRWNTEYIEFPGYGGGKIHTGNFVRKDLLIGDSWDGPTDRSASFADGVVLHGIRIRAPEVQPSSWLFVELGLSTRPRPNEPIRLLFVLDDGEVQIPLEVPLGLDDWYPVTDWQQGEVFRGRVTLPVPQRARPGRYGLAVVVLGPDGVLPAEGAGPAGVLDAEPRYARGEVWFPDVVHIQTPDQVRNLASADVQRAVQKGNQLDCVAAEAAWEDARAHYMVSSDWQASVRPGVQASVANCWALTAERAPDHAGAVRAIRNARRWDRIHPTVLRVGSALGAAWYAEAVQAREEGRIEDAYAGFRDTLYADPSRSWARRYAEELRVIRLDIQN
ncbi:MAG: hypothetical protein R3F61_23390 [Myxococcota bacterium]